MVHNKKIVEIGNDMNEGCEVENGTPQGSIVSPLLFSLMINDIFINMDKVVGVALFVDDGVMWKRGGE